MFDNGLEKYKANQTYTDDYADKTTTNSNTTKSFFKKYVTTRNLIYLVINIFLIVLIINVIKRTKVAKKYNFRR